MEDNLPPTEELMTRIATGDAEAFEILVNRHQTNILNLVCHFLGNRAQVNDLAQEVFLRIWQTANKYEPTAKFTTWIYKITANLCLNELKAARRRRWFSFHPFDRDSETSIEETFLDDSPTAEDLRSLPANQRMALVLKIYDDLPYQEIARILGCSVSAVESLLVRAKKT